MARARKKHIQQAFEFRQHGGKREGAGRPPKGSRAGEPHDRREEIDGRHPLHVNTRVVAEVGSLRKRDLYMAIRAATITVFLFAQKRGIGFRIVQASIQRTHLHLIVEAEDKASLTAGMRVFLSSAARYINRALLRRTGRTRRGPVFQDRYRSRALTTPREVRNCLNYVLNNWRHHEEDRGRSWRVDPFSSGVAFPGWKERNGLRVLYRPPPTYVWLMTWVPKTWLLREGWRKHPLISVNEVPGPVM